MAVWLPSVIDAEDNVEGKYLLISSAGSDRLLLITPRLNTLTVAIARMRRYLLSGTIHDSTQQ